MEVPSPFRPLGETPVSRDGRFFGARNHGVPKKGKSKAVTQGTMVVD